MSEGFANNLINASNELIRSAMESPNYVPGVSGWAIRADGSAEFNSITLPGSATGITVTFAAIVPSNPKTGDVWYDTSNGLLAHQWNGSAWISYQIGTPAIANGSITGPLLGPLVTARSLGGITTTISSTVPSNPVTGDVWINSGNGYQLEQWNGTAWTPIVWNATNVIAAGTVTATQIMANTITATQLAAGIVYAGIVDATTITAAQFIAYGANAEYLGYSGTPALGNLIFSVAPSNGTDPYGNAYKQGVAIYKGKATANLIVDPNSGVPALNMPSGAGSESQFGSVYTIVANPGAVNEAINTWLKGPASTYDNIAAAIVLTTANKDGSNIGAGELTSGGATIAEWYGSGFHLLQPLYGWNGVLNIGDNLSMAAGKGIVGRDANWVTVGMASGWTNRGGAYPTFQVMRVAVAPGICWVRGNIQSSTSISNGSVFATFGPAYQPALTQSLPLWVWGGTAVMNNQAHIEIDNAGNVKVWGIGTAGTCAIAFSGLMFMDAL